MRHHETIVAPITAAGGAVGVVRVSGPDAWAIASSVFESWPEQPESHRAVHGRFMTGDDGLGLPFEPGRGYTGEEAVEFSVHGSAASMNALVDACLSAGARMAEPGEFTLRAFMNGRLDLSQAEAVRDTVAAQTDLQLRFANAQRDGLLRERVSWVRDEALRLLAAVEASVDFSEEIGELDRSRADVMAGAMHRELEALLATERLGRIVRKGLRIALIGKPNVGKSSLLNALLRADRVIVTPIAGTTRDTIEESVVLGGIPCVVIDTAGLRETDDPVEVEGVLRARSAMEGADVIWHLVEGCSVPTGIRRDLLIWTKADLPGHDSSADGLHVSAITGQGIDALSEWIASFADATGFEVAIDPRHAPLLERALQLVVETQAVLASELPDDLLSTLLREIASTVGEITGETASGDMIERIFADFCIGK